MIYLIKAHCISKRNLCRIESDEIETESIKIKNP